jgi:hypothetical protein
MPDKKRQIQQHRERGADDDVEHAPESGEPTETGRSQGKPVNEKGDETNARKTGKGEHWESGRHKAT